MWNWVARRMGVKLIRTLISFGRYEAAKKLLQQLIAKDNRDYNAWLLLGWCNAQQQAFEKALAAYDHALQVKPDLAYAHAEMGCVLARLSRYKEGAEYLQRAMRIQPGFRKKLSYAYAMGVCTARLDRLSESLACFETACNLDPSSGSAFLEMGWVLLHLERYEEAEITLRKAIALCPDNAFAHQCLGLALVELERFGEAEPVLRRAVVLDPKDGISRFNFGRVLTELGRLGDAVPELEEAARLDPIENGTYAGLWLAQSGLRNWEEALRAAEMLASRVPGNADPLAFRAIALVELGRLDEAEAAIRQSMDISPNSQSAHEALAQLHLKRSEFEEVAQIANSGKVPAGSAVELLKMIADEHLRAHRLDLASQQVDSLRQLDEEESRKLAERIASASAPQN